MTTLHTIRVIYGEFDDILEGKQSFLVVRDRGYREGDLVCLLRQTGMAEADVDHRAPKPEFRISKIKLGGHTGLILGYVVLSLQRVEERVAA